MRAKFISLLVILLLLCSTSISFAAVDPAVTIVNPKGHTTANNILISIKVTQPKTIRISLLEEKQLVNGEYVSIDINKAVEQKSIETKLVATSMKPATFTTNNNLTFCTKQVNGLKPGVYKLKVETLNKGGAPIYIRESHFGILTKEEVNTSAFENQQSGTSQFLQNILKSIFGS